ncbi:hypothetical protein N865_16905 [Intrasporangium oryzae NRRL B-24470]|uniref:Uncharacterized protein n=1 Tax=Intrasporangium oryzae NRRL B-24470 TaxID=1386089 RepID=W9GB27_9MICO|nr:hypothetical protein [Intrasporangium oryzae]EWT03411.1 hypothetical protein N865_16905 [Intrasporangium oryzae NRRL B-24470]
MRLFDRRRRPDLDVGVRQAVPLGDNERILAWAKDDDTGGHVVACTHHLAFVGADGLLEWSRPWHEAESGTWQGDSSLLTVVWVDHRDPVRWRISQPSLIQQTLRERLQASVVIADEFRTSARRTVRVVIRQDLATGALIEQVVPGKGADLGDPEVASEAASRLARLRSEVGL